MKKLLAALAALVLVLAAVSAAPWGLPDASSLGSVQEGPAGLVCAVENTDLTASVYILRDNRLVDLYRVPRLAGGRTFSIAAAAWDDQRPALLRHWDDSSWDVVRTDGSAVTLDTSALDKVLTPTGLWVENETYYLTAVAVDGSVNVYTLTEGSVPTLELLVPAPLAGGVAQAVYDGTEIRATLVTGEGCFLTVKGQGTLSSEAIPPQVDAVSLSAHGWFLCKQLLLVAASGIWLVGAAAVFWILRVCRLSKLLSRRITAMAMGVLAAAIAVADVFLVAELVRVSGPSALPGAAARYGGASLAVLALAWLLLRLFTGRIARPITQMTDQMIRMSDGDVSVRQIGPGRDELHEMHQAMQELCMSLSIRDYELNCTVQSYGRFVPQGLTKLLNRASMAEIVYGDSRRMEGPVGLFSIANRDVARNLLEDAQFVSFVDHSFQLLDDSLQAHKGCLLSGSIDLASMEALFPNAAAGVRAGLDFLGRSRAQQEGGGPAPELFLLLHSASFLYGITGSQEKVFPYLSSSELEFLGSFSRQLYETGTRIVMTEPYHQQIAGCGFTTRYIGFVSYPDKDYACKLYEVLDAYPELDRSLRMRYNQRLQEAIHLFYRNDFYLARNLFSALLRACPEDGIARWYLFACEHFFNQEDGKEVDYQLFGIRE